MVKAKKQNRNISENLKVRFEKWMESCYDKASRLWHVLYRVINWCLHQPLYFTIITLAIIGARLFWFYSLNHGDDGWTDALWYRHFIEGCWWAISFCLLYILYLTALVLYYVAYKHPHWWHICLYPIIICSLLLIPMWEPVQTGIPYLSFPCLVSLCLIVIGIYECATLYRNRIKYPSTINSGESGFVTKTEQRSMIENGWTKYVNTMFDLVGEQQLRTESFAIGIAGSWGSGKTTFYEAIKSHLEQSKKFAVYEFKPWQIIESSRIAPDFFAGFAQILSKENKDDEKQIRKSLAQYAQVLTEVPRISEYAKPIVEHLNNNQDETIDNLRKKIDSLLEKENTYVAVMIDDLDRLDREELLEIMRLVRASANFKHVLFILTYDKKYFETILDDARGLEYLKKIVNVEISLPAVEQYKYGKLLYDSVNSIFNVKQAKNAAEKTQYEKCISLLNKLIGSENAKAENSLLYKHLHNFRDVKRFANQFGLVLRHLAKQELLDQFNLSDLFWIELLHYVDEKTYNDLQNNYANLLTVDTINATNRKTLTLKATKEERISQGILSELFPPQGYRFHPLNSIAWVNNYYCYFAHRLMNDTISATEFKELMLSSRREAIIGKLVPLHKKSQTQSRLQQILIDYPQYGQFETEIEANNYTCILLEILKNTKSDEWKEIIIRQFGRKYRNQAFKRIPSYDLMPLLEKFITENPSACWNKVLTSMCISKNINEVDNEIPTDANYILSIKQLEELALLNFNTVHGHKKTSLSELFKPTNEQISFTLSLSYTRETAGNVIMSYGNLLGAHLFKFFNKGKRRKILPHEQFVQIMDNLFKLSKIKRGMDESNITPLVRKTLEQTVGSVENFETFVNGNFRLEEPDVVRYNTIGLNFLYRKEPSEISLASKPRRVRVRKSNIPLTKK